MEKEFEKECIDVQLNHSAAHLKLTQHYTSTIFQHKIKIKLKFQKERPLKKNIHTRVYCIPKMEETQMSIKTTTHKETMVYQFLSN